MYELSYLIIELCMMEGLWTSHIRMKYECSMLPSQFCRKEGDREG